MDAPISADKVDDASACKIGAAYVSNGEAGDSGTSATVEEASSGLVEVSGVLDEAGGGEVDDEAGGGAVDSSGAVESSGRATVQSSEYS